MDTNSQAMAMINTRNLAMAMTNTRSLAMGKTNTRNLAMDMIITRSLAMAIIWSVAMYKIYSHTKTMAIRISKDFQDTTEEEPSQN